MTLDTFFKKFDTFAAAPDAVARMRELVLRLAMQGKLSKSNASDDTIQELLTRIRNEREQLVDWSRPRLQKEFSHAKHSTGSLERATATSQEDLEIGEDEGEGVMTIANRGIISLYLCNLSRHYSRDNGLQGSTVQSDDLSLVHNRPRQPSGYVSLIQLHWSSFGGPFDKEM